MPPGGRFGMAAGAGLRYGGRRAAVRAFLRVSGPASS